MQQNGKIMDNLKRLSLYNKHLELHASFFNFAGFYMPIHYGDIKAEVQTVREHAGVFDISHMGQFIIHGKEAVEFVDYIITNEFYSAPIYKAVYSPICREDGTTLDDLIAYKLDEQKVLLCVNAINIQKDWNWINSHIKEFNCIIKNVSDKYSLIAIQGPNSKNILKELSVIEKGFQIKKFYSKEINYSNEKIILARTGYTGEDGFEIFCSHKIAENLWKLFINNKIPPCGLAARDILRLEACYPLYGNEITDKWTPIDAGLKWTVKIKKKKFIGKSSLEHYKPIYKLVNLSLDKGIPRQGYDVCDKEKRVVGKVTSGTMSILLKKGICMALIENSKIHQESCQFTISIRNKYFNANKHLKSFIYYRGK